MWNKSITFLNEQGQFELVPYEQLTAWQKAAKKSGLSYFSEKANITWFIGTIQYKNFNSR